MRGIQTNKSLESLDNTWIYSAKPLTQYMYMRVMLNYIVGIYILYGNLSTQRHEILSVWVPLQYTIVITHYRRIKTEYIFFRQSTYIK